MSAAPPGDSPKYNRAPPAQPEPAPPRPSLARGVRFPPALRRLLRALHRDAGYLCVGLTFVYALSGLAVNHIEDWDPNFTQLRRTFQLELPQPSAARVTDTDQARRLAEDVLNQLGRSTPARDVYAPDESHVDITLEDSTLYVDLEAGEVREEGQKDRFLLRVANWLHLNRGKRAWTYIADGYASGLLFLAVSGLFMLPGRKGLLGRGGLLVAAGALVPIGYVVLSGGP